MCTVVKKEAADLFLNMLKTQSKKNNLFLKITRHKQNKICYRKAISDMTTIEKQSKV